MRRILGGLALVLLTQGAAFAQTEGSAASCQTVARNMCAPGGVGQLANAQGTVLISRGIGFAEIEAGAPLKAGDRILVKNGTATLALGASCTVPLKKNSMATLINRDGSLCAVGLRPDPSTVAADLPSRNDVLAQRDVLVREDAGLNPAFLVGGAVVGAGLIGGLLLLNDGDNRRPRPSISRGALAN